MNIYDRELLYSGPLFTHQLSHMWIDFRGIRDEFMRRTAATTSRTAGRRRLCSRNTRSAIPGISSATANTVGASRQRRTWLGKRVVDGVEREFFDYIARGAPFGPDDGTVAPWVVVASLPFAPEIVIPTALAPSPIAVGDDGKHGFKPSFNQTFAMPG